MADANGSINLSCENSVEVNFFWTGGWKYLSLLFPDFSEGRVQMEESDGRLPRFLAVARGSGERVQEGSKVAETANALEVYEDAVQEPLLECTNLASMYYGAQEIGSRRPEARILREDFCSSAIIAQTWLGLDQQNRAQAVDIDLEALKVAYRRISRSRTSRLIQSSTFSSNSKATILDVEDVNLTEPSSRASIDLDAEEGIKANTSNGILNGKSNSTSTWDVGASSERFERRFQARKAKAALKQARVDRASPSPVAREDALILLHADVLSLPLADMQIEDPDLIYAGNYALSYFHTRKSLLEYLTQCRKTLCPQTGVLIVDPFGGPTSWDPKTESEIEEQKRLWKQFSTEPGFLRDETKDPPAALKGEDLEFWSAFKGSSSGSDWRDWPRGRLVLVRKGDLYGGYEYWREDGPIDYATNRFRMSLSFRFTSDGSWLRDYFSYDFRVWSLKEIIEAMEEVGFERIQVQAIPRDVEETTRRRKEYNDNRQLSNDSDYGRDVKVGSLDGMMDMANLMQRTEEQESQKCTYQHLQEGQKLFAMKSFGTYIIACMPNQSQQ